MPFRYTFSDTVPMADVESTIVLAIFAVESLHGEEQVRLDAAHFLDIDKRACVIDVETLVGRDLNRLFLGFMRREFGDDAFRVEKVERSPVRANGFHR